MNVIINNQSHVYYRQGHLGMVILLMRYGANPEVLDKEGQYVLHVYHQLITIVNCIKLQTMCVQV